MNLDGVLRRIAAVESRIRDHIAAKIASLIYASVYSVTSSDGLSDGVEGRPNEDGVPQVSARRMQHAGFRSRPPVGSIFTAVKVEGGSRKLVIVAEDDGQGGSVTLAEGEAAMYSPAKPTSQVLFDKDGGITVTGQSSAQVKIDKTGAITVTSATGRDITVSPGTGGSVVLASGTKPIARQGDTAGPYPITGGNPFALG